MDICFQAVYEHGVLRPLEPLRLQESEVVSLIIQSSEQQLNDRTSSDEELGRRQRDMLLAFVSKMESLPQNSPQDGLNNRDHDRLIYGS
jgi:predicted DNA-binding antitoxin AbrB/MazE fold protein